MSKIISLSASNFKKITAVEITPAGNVITLTGDNGAGKSSILDAIQSALAGGKTIPDEPIRRGEEHGSVTIKLDDLTVTRTFTPAGGTLRVENAQGHKQGSPQNLLDKLVGNLAFDPLAFSRLRSHEQWEQLRELVGLNFEALDAERQKVYDDRTIIGRELLRQQTLLKEISPEVDNAPNLETSAASVIAKIDSAQAKNLLIEVRKHKANKASGDLASATHKVAEAEEEIRNWQIELENRKKLLEAAKNESQQADIELNKDNWAVDVEPLKEELRTLEANNTRAREKQRRTSLVAGVKIQGHLQGEYTQRINEIDAIKTNMIADARFPLSELSFDGEQITYRGIRFAQCSDGEKLRVSVAVGMALNPKLRVIFVRDGSLLDKNGLQTIADLAKEYDYQVWLEDARSEDPTAIEIIDGHIKL